VRPRRRRTPPSASPFPIGRILCRYPRRRAAGGHTSFDPGSSSLSQRRSRFLSAFSGGVFGVQCGHHCPNGTGRAAQIDFSGADSKVRHILGRPKRSSLIFNHKSRSKTGFGPWQAWLSDISQLCFSTAPPARLALYALIYSGVLQPLGSLPKHNPTYSTVRLGGSIGLEMQLTHNCSCARMAALHAAGSLIPTLVAPVNGFDDDNFSLRTTVDFARAALAPSSDGRHVRI